MKLWRYIQGFRKGKEAHHLEKEAMTDPFLAHALRGYDRVKGQHARNITQLQSQVQQRSRKKPAYLRAAGIAASILVIFGIGTYMLIGKTDLSKEIKLAAQYELNPDTSIPAAPQPPVITKIPETLAKQQPKQKVVSKPVLPAAAVSEEEIQCVEEVSEKPMEDAVMLEEVVVTQPVIQKKQVMVGASRVKGLEVKEAPIVKGQITDQHGEPLIGANVKVSGTNKGTVTDTDGYFELSVAGGEKIKVEYIGYETLDIPVDTAAVMQIAMNDDQTALDEVVVVGYGTSRKSVMREPKPVNGKKNYKKYMKENLVPPTDECSEVKGKVVLCFNVDIQGRPFNITVEKSLCPSADQEAIRLLSEGPDWTQGNKPGKLEVKF